MLSWGAPVILGKDELRRKRPIWMLILLMIATQGLYAPVWLALSWRELKRDVPDLSWNSVLHGAAWCPLVFAALWALIPAVPGIVWPAANFVGVVRVREHFRVLAALPGELALRTTVVVAAASGYIVGTWVAIQEVAANTSVDIGHYLDVLVAVVLGSFVVIQGQRLVNSWYDEFKGYEVRTRSHPLEWATAVLGLLVQMANYTLI